MKIDLTEKQFRRLLDLVYVGNWVMNSTRGDDRIQEYDDVESAVFAHCLSHGMVPLVEAYQGELIPSRAFAEGGIHEAIMAYEDTMFFEILAQELALRDMDSDAPTPENVDELRERMDSMHAIEKSADEVRHDMMDELVTAFITPFDREDIDELGHVLDDVTDSIEGVLNRMYYDNVTDMRDDAVQMSDMVVRATESICELVNELPRFRHSKTLRELVFAINTIETDADHLFIESMRTLHTTCTDPLQVFAWHDVYRHLEQCSDDCERVANTIDSIVMKNS